MSIYKDYSDKADFWADFSKKTEKGEDPSSLNWTETVQLARKKRTAIDKEDCEAARREYGDRFNSIFTYRKASETRVLKDPPSIARKYRKMKNCPRPWDND